jgi:hypothetical protein
LNIAVPCGIIMDHRISIKLYGPHDRRNIVLTCPHLPEGYYKEKEL